MLRRGARIQAPNKMTELELPPIEKNVLTHGIGNEEDLGFSKPFVSFNKSFVFRKKISLKKTRHTMRKFLHQVQKVVQMIKLKNKRCMMMISKRNFAMNN